MPEGDNTGMDAVPEDAEFDRHDDQWRPVYSDDVRAGRRYRPGRGGFDPEAAALAARAKYARRQRAVLTMLLLVVATGLVAGFVAPVVWWAHGAVDVLLVGYLVYLRRQVRIEEDVRARRLARLSEPRVADSPEQPEEGAYEEFVDQADYTADVDFEEPPEPEVRQRPQGRAAIVEIDDEDPMFDELDERTFEPYRRASGE